jgi:hypothetical protein
VDELLCWLHLQRVIEAVEIVEEADRGQKLDDLAFIKVLPQLIPELFIDGVSIARDTFSQTQRGFLFFAEVGELLEIGEIIDLLVCPAVPSCQDGVRGQSIFAAIHLRDAHDHQFFQFDWDRTCLHDGAKMRDHGAHDLRPVRHSAEHIGNVSAGLHEVIKDLCDFGRSR